MKNKLTSALLFAGLFLSLNVYADNCVALAGQEVSVLSFETECPFTTTIDVGGDNCILERKSRAGQSEFICTLASGTWMGGPWQYTGSAFNQDPDDPSNPIPDDLSEIRQPREYTGAEASNFSDAQYHSENSLFAATNVLLRNQNGIHQNNVDRLVKHDQDVKNLLEHTISSVNFLGSNFSTSLTNLQNSNQALHKITHDNQAQEMEAIQQLNDQFNDEFISLNASAQYGNGMINEIWNVIGINGSSGGCGGFDCPPSYTLAQMLQINQQQLLDALSSGGSGDGTDQSQLLSFIEENTSSSSRTLKDIEDLLESIDEKTGTGGSDGGSDDDTETNFKLDIINDSLNRIDGTLLGTHQGLSMQLGQQLDDIKTAIENGGGVDPDVNEKLDTLIQNTALSAQNAGATNDNVVRGTAAIGEKLDAIGQDVSELTGAFDAGIGKQDGPVLCTGDDCYKGKSWITPKYPDGLTSIYENHKLAFQESDIHTYLQGFNPIISGAAPSEWRFCVDVGIANFGCHSLELPPYILSFVRLCILITAGFLCRRLIFGG